MKPENIFQYFFDSEMCRKQLSFVLEDIIYLVYIVNLDCAAIGMRGAMSPIAS